MANKIIRTYGQGFLEEKANGPKVLHLNGTAYERGYQHGMLLADEIEECLSAGVTAVALSLGTPWGQIGGGDYEAGLKKSLGWGKVSMEPWIPPKFKQEMQGMADALAAKGSNITYDDIVAWNVITDTEIFFFHPHPVDMGKPGIRVLYPPVACSTFCAFGEATQDGTMIYAKNMDFFATPELGKNVLAMVVNPSDGGHGFFVVTVPGILGLDGGMNDIGLCVGINYSGTQPETLQGVGYHFMNRIPLQYADSIDDAINLVTVYPGATGILYHVADAKTTRAAIIESTANEIAVRYPEEAGKDIIWASNHFNCYPGWQGYNGYNMVTNQVKAFGLEDISTVEKWQESLEKCFMEEGKIGRYARLRQLLNENYGKITMDKAIEIGSDRYDLKSGRLIGKDELCGFTTVSQFVAKDEVLADDITYYKSSKRGAITESIGNLWSKVAVPATGDVWLAGGTIPANRGTFRHFNLLEELGSS